MFRRCSLGLAAFLLVGAVWAQKPEPPAIKYTTTQSTYSTPAVQSFSLGGTTATVAGAEADVPLKRVVLFSSGVGYFEHAGKVNGDAKLEMKFKPEEINDLLKSMVVQDFGGGQVSTITYGSKDPITKTLKSFSVDLTSNPTLAQLLGQLRGERVVLDAPKEISGVIVGMETRKKALNDHETIDVDVLNLLTSDGLQAIPLDGVGRIKLANAELDAELRKALTILASAHATDKKSVTLSFLGHGERRVSVGYIQATPVWKTTYRLVLRDGRKPYLQGWAIVENTSEDDWSGVQLRLVSGRPISFTMDLYQPLYVLRPQEQLELYSSLRPQVYGQDLADKGRLFAAKGKARGGMMNRIAGPGGMPGMMGPGGPMGPMSLPPGAPAEAAKGEAGEEGGMGGSMDLNLSGVQSAAEGGNVGNLFQYAIKMPVNLPRQQSAMLPIAGGDIEGQKVSIYNAGVEAKHPLYGLKFTNQTGLYLMQGPITVFDSDIYAGDARIEDLPPGGQRIISYGLDLDTEVAVEAKRALPEELLSVKLWKGTMVAAHKYVQSFDYTVKNSSKQAKTVLIEYPVIAEWTLVKPKQPTEKTRDFYRFAVDAKPGEPAKLGVQFERTDRQQIALTNLDDPSIQSFVSSSVVSEKVKDALRKLVRMKAEFQRVVQERQQLEQRIAAIGEDQSRIRQNMAQLDRNSDIYRSYVKKFSDQEAEIEKLRGQAAEKTAQEANLRKTADEFLMGLDLE